MTKRLQLRALSVRQPYAQLILAGTKSIEYRPRRTNVRGLVYIYACKARGPQAAFAAAGLDPDELLYGLVLGTVEIVDCTRSPLGYEWQLQNPEWLAKPLEVTGMPQPSFFWPW
jgi:hypothetical protein